MNYGRAQSIVFMSGMTVFFLGWFSSAKQGDPLPPAKFLIGASVTFLGLEVLADISPDLAAALAIAVGTTAFFHYGSSILTFINAEPTTATPAPAAAVQTPVHVAPQR